MRPRSIVSFERIVMLIVVISLAAAVLDWNRAAADLERAGVGAGVVMAALAAVLGIILVLMWLISQRRSNVAKWIYVVITVGMLAASAPSLGRIMRAELPLMILNLAYLLLALLSLWLLFRPDTRGWFGGHGPDTPAA